MFSNVSTMHNLQHNLRELTHDNYCTTTQKASTTTTTATTIRRQFERILSRIFISLEINLEGE